METGDKILTQVQDGWIELRGGGQFFFGEIKKESIHIADIAHALGNICRYNGHTQAFYSVAEHCVLMSRWAEKQVPAFKPQDLMLVLLHDASEAYIGDMTRPLKARFPLFKELEEQIHAAVAARFGTQYPHPQWLKDLDTRILRDERHQAMTTGAKVSDNEWFTDGLAPLGVQLSFWDPKTAATRFLQEFERIASMMSVAA